MAGSAPSLSAALEPPTVRARAAATRRDVAFSSEGVQLSGWLYEPTVPGPWPLVLMTHGFTATRSMTTDKFAEALSGSGCAVLLYDHRGFGASGGEPRRVINAWSQARGYLDAIAFGESLNGIDRNRIALWGDSMSGGVAFAVAAVDRRVSALMVQVPAFGSSLPPADADGSLFQALRETILRGTIEPAGSAELEGPLPVVSDDQLRRPSALAPLTAYRWFIEYGGRFDSGWLNDVTRARPKTPVAWHPGLCAPHVSCPSLFLVSPRDEMPGAMPAVVRAAYDRIDAPKTWVDIEGGHFGLLYHPSAEFDHAAAAQVAFVSSRLVGR